MMAMSLPPEEPEAGPWAALTVAELAERLLVGSETAVGRPWVVALDGRGGSGKSTLAQRLVPHVGPSIVVHTDDLAWHEPFFGWGRLLEQVLRPLLAGKALELVPPAWPAHGRSGAITVPAGLRVVVVEGNAAAQREVADLVDRVVWVQTDVLDAERRALVRDVEEGVNGDAEAAKQFWDEWMAVELPFFAADRPWERADIIVAGAQVLDLADDEIACAAGPL